MAVVKNLMVRSGADFSALYKEMNRAQKRMSAFQKGISKTMKVLGITLGSLAVGKLIKDSISAAMNVENSMLQIQRTMGDSANAFNEWAQTQAKAFGMAREEAFKYGATYSNLISSFTKDTQETARYTTELLKASAVVASATGRTMEDTMERIRSGLLGNTEAIEDLGIHVNVAMLESTEAFRQFARGRSWQQLSFQEQQQIRLLSILEQANLKYGDSLAGTTQTRQLMFLATLKNIRLNLGQAFLPIYNTVLPILTALASKLEYVTAILAQFMQALFGTKQAQQHVKTAQAQAEAVEELGDATAKAGKQAKGALAGFDEINQLADKSAGTGEVAIGGVGVDTEAVAEGGIIGNTMTAVSEKAQEMAAKVKAAYGELSSFIKRHSDIIIAALAGVGAALATYFAAKNWSTIAKTITTIFSGMSKAIGGALGALVSPLGLIATGIAAATTAFVYFYRTNERFRGVVDSILQTIGEVAIWLWQNVLVPLGQFLASIFVSAWEGVKRVVESFYRSVLIPLGDFLKWFWNTILVPVARVLIDVFAVAFEIVASVAKALWQNVFVPLASFITGVFVSAMKGLVDIMSYWWNSILRPLASFISTIFKPVIEALSNAFLYLWNNVLLPLIQFMAGNFKTVFESVTASIKSIIDGLKSAFMGFINFITGVFTLNWQRAWLGIKDIFSGVLDAIKGIFRNTINGIVEIANRFIDSWNSIKLKVPEISIPFVGTFGGFTISLPKIQRIPRLAQGGIIDSPTLAMLGEAGREAVLPLENNTGWIDELANKIASIVGTGETTIIVKVGEDTLAEKVISNINRRNRIAGRTVIQL